MDLYRYNGYMNAQQEALNNKQKTEELIKRAEEFKTVSTLADAQKLAEKIMPTNQEITIFYSGSAKCVIVNRKDMMRLSIETGDKYICYDFS